MYSKKQVIEILTDQLDIMAEGEKRSAISYAREVVRDTPDTVYEATICKLGLQKMAEGSYLSNSDTLRVARWALKIIANLSLPPLGDRIRAFAGEEAKREDK